MPKIAFDTCGGIKYIAKEFDLSSLGINTENTHKYLSVITRMELLAKPEITEAEEHELRAFLADSTVTPIDDDVEKLAIEIRRTRKLKLPDCIIAATAILLEATLLTYDGHLTNLEWPGYKFIDISTLEKNQPLQYTIKKSHGKETSL